MNETVTSSIDQRGAAAITAAFQRRNQAGEKALVAYIMAGDPDMGTTEAIIRALSGIDVDVIELGLPFSDPLADGPVIQRASQRALNQNISMRQVFDRVKELRLDIRTPIVLMTYYNLFFRYGLDAFSADAAAAGVDGVIVPDLPAEESDPLLQALDANQLALIPLLAPTSTGERVAKVVSQARGFVYYVSRTGVTGEQKDLAPDLVENLERIRAATDLPLGVGFGISTPEQARDVARHADGVVMGSVIVRLIEETDHLHERVVAKFLKPFVDTLHHSAS